MAVEPSYIHKRHESFRSGTADAAPAAEATKEGGDE